ncbi:hypothetical protein ACHAXS_005127 [Conticribra weissflogii]
MPRGQRRKFKLQVTLSKVISRELTRRVRKKSIEPDIINQAALVSPRQIRDVLTPVASELIHSACHDSGCSGSHSNVASRDQKENIQHDNDSEYINIIEDDSISSKKIRCREIKSSDATSRFDEHQIDASRLRECVVEEKRLLQSSSKSRGLQVPMELEIEESRESNADNPKILCVHNDSISTGDKSSSKFKECNADGILDQNSAYASDKSSLTSFNSVSLKLHIGDMVHVTKEKHSKFGLQGMITKLTACFVYFKETTTNTTIQIKRDFVTRIAPEAPTSPLHSTSSSTNFFSVRPINDTSNNKTTSVTIHSRNQMMVCDILKPGDYVRVSKEKHPKYGSHGFIERKTNCFAFVKDSETSNTFRIKPEFLSLDSLSESGDTQETKISFNSAIQHECQQPLTGITHEVHNEATLELKNKTEGTEGRIKVKELHAKHGGKFGTIQRKTQLFHFVTFDEDSSKEVRIKSHFLTRLDGSNEIDVCNNAPINYRNSAIFDIQSWAVPPIPDNNKLKFGNFPIERVVVSMKQALDLDCVFKLIWNGRWKKVVFELDPKKNNELPIRDFTTCRTEGWELYYAEVDKTKVRGQHHGMFNQPKTVTAYYVQTEGPNVESVDLLQRELLLGDFSTLPSRKVWDRRHLSLSPAKKIDGQYALFQVGSSDIEMIDDVGTTGCGFIEEGYMAQLLGGNPTATRALAIQVRIHVPSKGIFKGMLMRKRGMARGRIELNESLQKVPPSKILEDGLKDGFITIKQMFPSDSSKQVDRIMTGAKMVTKTFTKGLKNGTECKFPPMVARIWEALNVPVDKIENYLSVSKYPANLRHSCQFVCALLFSDDPNRSPHILVSPLPPLNSRRGCRCC